MATNQDNNNRLIQEFLDRKRSSLRVTSIDELMVTVRAWVVFTPQLSDAELRSIIVRYYIVNMILPQNVLPMPSLANAKIVRAVKSAVRAVNKEVEVERTGGKIKIGVSGLTAELDMGWAKAAVGVSWGGTLILDESLGDFHFSGELSKQHWELRLSYPQETPVPDLGKLGNIFGEGEEALRGIIRDSRGLANASDIRKTSKEFNEHMERIKQAVAALKAIARTPTGKPIFSLSLASPPALPGQEKIPPGIAIMGWLSWFF